MFSPTRRAGPSSLTEETGSAAPKALALRPRVSPAAPVPTAWKNRRRPGFMARLPYGAHRTPGLDRRRWGVSLLPEGGGGGDARRPTGGEIAREEGGRAQQKGRDHERERIESLDREEQSLDRARGQGRGDQPDGETDGQEPRSVADHEPHDLRRRRAEHEPHADLPHTLGDGVGDDAVDADDRQRRREHGEHTQE